MAIESGDVIDGRLPGTAAKLVREWCLEHQAKLAENLCRRNGLELSASSLHRKLAERGELHRADAA